MDIIARNLKKIRDEFKLTPKELAAMVHYSYSFLRDVENERSQLSVHAILEISARLGIRPAYFFSEPNDNDNKISEIDMIQRIAYLNNGREILEELKEIDKLDDSQRQDILQFIKYIKSKNRSGK